MSESSLLVTQLAVSWGAARPFQANHGPVFGALLDGTLHAQQGYVQEMEPYGHSNFDFEALGSLCWAKLPTLN